MPSLKNGDIMAKDLPDLVVAANKESENIGATPNNMVESDLAKKMRSEAEQKQIRNDLILEHSVNSKNSLPKAYTDQKGQ